MNQKMTWNLYSTAMLLDAYLQIQENPVLRSKLLIDLSQFLRKQVKASDLQGSPYGTMADVNQKFGKMEFLMTKGERGIPGKPFPFMEELVHIYETDTDQYQLYLQAARENRTIEEIEKEIAEQQVVEAQQEGHSVENEIPNDTLPIVSQASEAGHGLEEAEIEALYYTNSSIDELPVSNRVKNALHRHDIHTLEELMACKTYELERMGNIGPKSLAELMDVLAPLKAHWGQMTEKTTEEPSEEEPQLDVLDTLLQDSAIANQVRMWMAKDYTLETPIEQFPMSVRTRNVLHRQEIKIMGDLQNVTLDSWKNVRNCGNLVFHEIRTLYGFVLSFAKENTAASTVYADIPEEMRILLESFLGKRLPIILKDLSKEEVTEETFLPSLWANPLYQTVIEGKMIAKVHDVLSCSLQELQSVVPEKLFLSDAFRQCIERLVEKKKICVDHELVTPRYMTLAEFIPTIPNEKYRKAFRYRLEGEKLDEIGAALQVTRERARQLNQKVLAKRPHLEEDKALPIWDTYVYLNDTDYQTIFCLSKQAVNYFRLVSKSHAKQAKGEKLRFECLRQVIHDFAGKEEIVTKAKALLKENQAFFLIDGEKIRKARPDLVRYAVSKYCQDTIPFTEFMEKYKALLIQLGVADDQKLIIGNERALGSRLESAEYVLWQKGSKLRYYDISAVDEDVLLEEIGLFSYKDIEISTKKFFMDHPETMEEYDIRDEYEMHNFLKKIWDMEKINDRLDSHHQMTFGRMPIITIGQGNREKQVLDLIKNNSPIKVHDLAEKYEETYGVNANSVLANFLGCADKYLLQDTYSVHWKSLPDDIVRQMKERLTEDFYFLDEVQDIFMDEFPEENVWLLNPHTLRELGFLTYSNYVVRDTYSSAAAYFKHLICGKCADLRDKSYLTSIGTFYALMIRERNAFQIVEVEPLMYVNIDYLNEQGITKDQLYDFWKLIENTIEEGEFFTIYSLKKRGISLPWQEMYFKNWFYSSVLLEDKAHFTYKRYAACRLFRKSTKQFTLGDFLLDIIHKTGKEFEFHELMHYLSDEYGFCPKDYKIKEVIASDYELSEKIIVY